MDWFLNLNYRSGALIGAWLGPILLISGCCAIIGGLYALAKSGDPRSQWAGKRWAPPVILVCGFLLIGFANLMNLTGSTMGVPGQFGAGGAIGYVPLDTGALAGMSAGQAFVAVLGSFRLFFGVVGACVCYRGIMAAIGVAKGTRRHGMSVPVVYWIFGSLVARLDVVAGALVSLGSRIG